MFQVTKRCDIFHYFSVSYSKELSGVLIRYLMFTCSEEIVGLVGHETSLASVLAVLNVLLSSVDCAHALIIEGKRLC